MSTPCATPSCVRRAQGYHRFCCRRCRYGEGHGGHGRGCDSRASAGSAEAGEPKFSNAPTLTFSFPIPNHMPAYVRAAVVNTAEQFYVRIFLLVISHFLMQFPPQRRRRFLQQLLLIFHPDRCPLDEAHALAVVLTQLLEEQ